MASAAAPTVSNGLTPPQKGPVHRGVVKQILSGDTVVIRGQPRGGPPPEKTISISNVTAPRLARRPTENNTAADAKDQPFAWEAREFLRERLIGREVSFVVDYKVPSGREFGFLYLPKPGSEDENMAELLVSEGLVEVRQPPNNRAPDEYVTRLMELETIAKGQKKGKWGDEEEVNKHVRDIQWTHENPRHLVDSLRQKPMKAVIEHVRDGSTVRAFLLPDFHYITLMISGIKCPVIRTGAGGEVVESEPYANEARYFIESRLMQRDIEIVLESVSNQNFIGTIKHPNGNIAEALLREGFAKCVDWSLAIVTDGPEKLRAAEKVAKDKRIRVWAKYEPPTSSSKKTFNAKVVEINLADSLIVQKDNGEIVKIHLSSIKPPKNEDAGANAIAGVPPQSGKENQQTGRNFRPLYDVPFMFEARELLRKRLIGKTVSVTVDYVQPAQPPYPEKTQCTVVIGQINVAEALVSKGLATVVRYRQDDENRSSQYDMLLAAEAKAEKSGKGIHALKNGTLGDKVPIVRVQEMQGDVNKSRQFLPHLQRTGRCEGVVEFVASGSRMRIYVPKETCLLTFLLAGISCPRGARPVPGSPGVMMDGEPYGDEAAQFTKLQCMQREVEIEVESMDKAGNFVGWLFVDGKNLSEELLQAGLASIHFTAERSKYYSVLLHAEEQAKAKRIKMWEHFVDNAAVEAAERAAAEKQDRVINYKKVVATECSTNGTAFKFAAQFVDEGPQLEQLMREIRTEFEAHPPVRGTYQPRRGELCAAKYVDGAWYRAKCESIRTGRADVYFIDFGNRENVDVTSSIAQLPPQFHSQQPGAREFTIALLQMPAQADPDAAEQCLTAVKRLLLTEKPMNVNVEYRQGGSDFVSVMTGTDPAAADCIDVGKYLIENGFCLVDARREKRIVKLVQTYQEAQEKAKRDRVNLWRYGDFMGDDDL